MQARITKAQAKYHEAFKAATTDADRQTARDEYERDAREIVCGERKTVAEFLASREDA